MRIGIATIPLDYGRCPYWLFERMKKLARGITLAVLEEFGTEEFLKRLSDPVWFQSLGCVMGFDYNSSGLTTTTLGALKEGLRGLESELGLFICGGKGKTSRKTPEQIQRWGEYLGWSVRKIEKLVYTSKMSAKVDSCLIQDRFQIYAHNLLFTREGQWSVIQQGMNTEIKKARRYHWFSGKKEEFTLARERFGLGFIEEPHSGIISGARVKPLNLTARESNSNREISLGLAKEEPKRFLKNFKSLLNKRNPLINQKRREGFAEMEMKSVEFYWHPVLKEKFNVKRLEKTIFFVHETRPRNFEKLLSLKGVGPKTIRALSLVSEIIYGAKPSYEDPARYSFAHGGKDATPYPVDRTILDRTIDILEKGIRKARISNREKVEAQRRLIKNLFRRRECPAACCENESRRKNLPEGIPRPFGRGSSKI